MSKPNLYTVGGTVQAGSGLYISRQADAELLQLTRSGTFAYVLTSRQVGKSSLMVRTAEQLAQEGIRSVMIDLTGLGSKLTEEAWYLGLLTDIADKLNLEIDVVTWWRSRDQLGAAQRFIQFFREVVLTKITAPVVVFVDEIDNTLGLPFTDDFYAGIRFFHNNRAIVPEFQRLSFVLIGVATPSDLISDQKRTPFNIGQRVDITDFTYAEALPLTEGLDMPPEQTRRVLQWAMKWTGGHPYLTQRLCRVIAEQQRQQWAEADVDSLVAATFFGKMSEHDNNLLFVSDMLTKRAPESALAVLSTYKEIRLGRKPVRDEELSPIKAHLKLTGVVTRLDGKLAVRNPIYLEVFDKNWIQEHWPLGWWQTVPRAVKIAVSFIALLLFSSVVLLALYAREQAKAINSEKLLAQEQKASRLQADSLLQKVREALAEAQAQRQEAIAARTISDSMAKEKDKSSAYAKTQQKLALQQAELAKMNENDARKNAAEANAANTKLQKSLTVEERYRRIDIAQKLILEATRQQQRGDAELGILLARQAFLFNQTYQGNLGRQIYEALRKTLDGAGGPYPSRGHTATVRGVAFNAAGDLLASASEDKTIRLWNRQQNFASAIVLSGHTQSVRALTFSPDGQTLASASDDKSVRLWNVRNPKASAKIFAGHRGGVWAVAFSADGKTLASGGADSTVRLWDVEKMNNGATWTRQHKSRVRAVILTPNGRWLGAAGDDGTIQLWPLADNNAQNVIEVKHGSGVKSLAFKPEPGLLASGGADGKVILWKWNAAAEPPKVQKEFPAHGANVTSIAFSPDGKRLATGSTDKSVKVWELAETSEAALVFAQDDNVWSVAFSPDGNTLAAGASPGKSGGIDKLLQIWITRTEILAAKACEAVKRNLRAEEWRTFVGADIGYEKTCDSLPGGKINSLKGAKDENK